MQIHLSVTTTHVYRHVNIPLPFHNQVVLTSFVQVFYVHCNESLRPWREGTGGMTAKVTLEAFYKSRKVAQAVPSPRA